MNDPLPNIEISAQRSQAVHLIGVLGAGMSALAKLYLERGWKVSGIDIIANDRLHSLRVAGALIEIGNAPSDLTKVDLVVFSPAISSCHPDILQARTLGLPLMTRARALAELIAERLVINVLGSHGKTTTSAMLAFLLERAGHRPGYMIGEACQSLSGRNARWSDCGPFVNESCEAFRALDFWTPAHCIVTGIDDEHSDHYGSFAELKAAFGDVLRRVPKGGLILWCSEDALLGDVAKDIDGRIEDYATTEGAVWRAQIRSQDAQGVTFDLLHRGQFQCEVSLALSGTHNVLNAVSAIAMASEFGCTPSWSAEILAGFTAVPRRWQTVGCWAGVRIYDDIAHHPTEVAATLGNATRATGASGRIIAVFQPQLYSRLARLEDAFVSALSAANQVVLLPVDAAGERASVDDANAAFCSRLLDAGISARTAWTVAEALRMVVSVIRAGDCVVAMGPAMAHQFAMELPDALTSLEPTPPHTSVAPDARAVGPRHLHSWFEDHAKNQPNAPCLIEGEHTLTYGELNAQAEKVAACLLARDFPSGALIALALEKSGELLAVMLGVLKAGYAFVPIDPKMRRASLNDLLYRVGAALVIEEASEATIPATALTTVDLDTFLKDVEQSAISVTKRALRSSDLAYCIFTSGTTGIPRLVGVTHENVTTLVGHSIGKLFEPADLALTPFIDSISFDACVHQIFATLSSGGCLLLEKDLASLVNSHRFQQITNLGSTPSVIGKLLASRRLPDGIRVISLGGEIIPQGLIAKLRTQHGLKKIYNLYGPAETTIFSTVAELLEATADRDPAREGTNIGHPISGTTIRILGPDGKDVPDGSTGEITIMGKGVSRGYLSDPVQTAARFGVSLGVRLFRTNDLGRRSSDGSIYFLGRMDDQIKVNGVRIDPTEIEFQIETFTGVERAAVVQAQAENGTAILTAFVIAKPGLDLSDLRQHLADRLPSVMVPRPIIQVDSLPMTATGKLLRRELAGRIPMARKRREPALLDGVERQLMTIWRSVLNHPDLSKDDDFFGVGGDSLASMQMVLMVEKAFGIRLPAQTLEGLSSLTAMAADIRRLIADPASVTKARTDIGAQLLDRQRAYLAGWTDGRIRQRGFIRSLDGQRGPAGLIWCCQGFEEYRALARELQEDLPVYGMRSGHMIMEYSPDTIQSLAMLYCEELLRWQPEGPFMLGGNCQGATIARATALALRARGRAVSALILMEQFSVWPYDQCVGLIFGRHSTHNPFLRETNPEPMLNSVYPAGYTLRIVDGGHGQFFLPKNIRSLADGIRTLLSLDRTIA